MTKTCSNCKNDFITHRNKRLFCSSSCAAIFNNKKFPKRKREKLFCLFCSQPLPLGNQKFCSNKCQGELHYSTVKREIINGTYKYVSSKTLRKYLFETRGRKCENCMLTVWMGKPIPLDVEHIDGNADNNNLNNIKLLCLNCHALTPTFKAKNKGNGRYLRMERYKKGLSY